MTSSREKFFGRTLILETMWSECSSAPMATRFWRAVTTRRLLCYRKATARKARVFVVTQATSTTEMFLPEGQILTASADGTLKQWNDENTQSGDVIAKLGRTPTAIRWVPGRNEFVVSTHLPTIQVFSVQGKELKKLRGHRDVVDDLLFSADGSRMYSASRDRTIKVWDTETWTELRTLKGHRDHVKALSLSGDGRQLVSGAYNGEVLLWDLEAFKQLKKFKTSDERGTPQGINGVAFSADGKRLLFTSNRLFELDIESGKVTHRNFGGECLATNGHGLVANGRF